MTCLSRPVDYAIPQEYTTYYYRTTTKLQCLATEVSGLMWSVPNSNPTIILKQQKTWLIRPQHMLLIIEGSVTDNHKVLQCLQEYPGGSSAHMYYGS